jgi:thiamine biosynthesis lipoprotein
VNPLNRAASHLIRLVLFAFLVLTSELRADDVPAAEPLRIEGTTMGSYYSIVVDSPGDTSRETLQQQIEADLREINRQMSTWDRKSEISQFNDSESTDWVPVSPEFAFVTEQARIIHKQSGGAFDVTLAPVIDLWGFGVRRKRRVPAPEEIQQALSQTGMDALTVRLEPPALKKTRPNLRLNLSALAPGYAVDRIVGTLERQGLLSYVVDISGEVRAGRAKSSGAKWKLGVESPRGGIHKVLEFTERSVATSGDYRNYFQVDGKRYSHVIDPKTGRPVDHPPDCVSVIHSSSMVADAWATTMMVLGADRGLQVAQEQQLEAMFLTVNSAGELIERSTPFFQAVPVHQPVPAQRK